MSNKFLSLLKTIGRDFLKYVIPWAATAGEVAVAAFVPALGPMFNQTVSAVIMAEQKYVALGTVKAGPQKLADVLQIMEPVIAQGLADAGKTNSTADVENYINSVVTILDAAPPPASS